MSREDVVRKEKVATQEDMGIILKRVFGYTAFRPLQEECIEAVLAKRDTLLIMPTGGGKSLCYQIPALMFEGVTVVISPLIALMTDQVRQLKALGVAAEMLNSTLDYHEYETNKNLVLSGAVKLLFMAPETLFKADIGELLKAIEVNCLTIDEAHCISEWGHDFRPEYRKLNQVRAHLPEAVCLAVTATATPRVRRDIVTNLELRTHHTLSEGQSLSTEFLASFNRHNLFYEVVPKSNPTAQTLDFLNRFKHQSGIIYCQSRKQVDALAATLNQQGFRALPYHAGLPADKRAKHQEAFIRDDVPIMVATIAFGMGINKPNVRFVIHFDLPKNIESYYQETGRAGRDDLPAHCLLLFGYGDIAKVRYFIDQKTDAQEQRVAQQHLNAMVHYAEAQGCRRIPLMQYFGEDYTQVRCGECDNCLNPKKNDFDLTEAAGRFFEAVHQTGQRFGATHVIDVLRGSQSARVMQYYHNSLDVHGLGKNFTVRQWQFFVRQFLQQGLLIKEEEYAVLKLTREAVEVINGERQVMGYPPPADNIVSTRVKTPKKVLGAGDANLFELLRAERKRLADKRGVPPYVIFPDKSLIDMSVVLPTTREVFSQIFGVGEKKLQQYADPFMQVIKDYQAKL